MKLEILSPEKTILSAEVSMVTVPGVQGRFTVLENHASIISMLNKGILLYKINGKEEELNIGAGFVEVNNNKVSVCIEQIQE